MVITGSEILARNIFTPAAPRTYHPETGMTFGAGPAGYDVRLKQALDLYPGQFALASSLEHFNVPTDLVGSTYNVFHSARLGLSIENETLEPGLKGCVPLRITNRGYRPIHLREGQPICRVVFHIIRNPPYGAGHQDTM